MLYTKAQLLYIGCEKKARECVLIASLNFCLPAISVFLILCFKTLKNVLKISVTALTPLPAAKNFSDSWNISPAILGFIVSYFLLSTSLTFLSIWDLKSEANFLKSLIFFFTSSKAVFPFWIILSNYWKEIYCEIHFFFIQSLYLSGYDDFK